MRMPIPRAAFALLLLVVAFNQASASKLRGTRTRRTNQDKLLFTEGARKGGNQKAISKASEVRSEDLWKSGSGNSYDDTAVAADDNGGGNGGGDKQKEGTIYDRSPMKFSRQGENSKEASTTQRDSKQGSKMLDSTKMLDNKGGAMKSQAAKYQVGKEKESETAVNSYDDLEGVYLKPLHESSARESEGSKGASKREPEAREDEGVYDEYNEEEPGKGTNKENGDATAAPIPGQAPISAPDRNMPHGNTQMQQMAEVAYVLSPFGLEYSIAIASAGVPTTTAFAEVEAATIAYLEEYVALTYNADAMIDFASAEIEAISRRTGGTGGTPFIDYAANVAFAEDSPITPSPSDIGTTISEAFQEPNLSAYILSLSSRLSSTNPFLSTTLVTVFGPDTNTGTQTGRVARSTPKLSATGMAAAAGAGLLTVFIGGYLVLKIRSENADMMGKFGKGSAGRHTLASYMDDNSNVQHDDGHSLDNTYNDDGSFLSSPPQAAVLNSCVDNSKIPHLRTFDQAPKEFSSKIVAFDISPVTGDCSSHGVKGQEDIFHDDEPVHGKGEAKDQTVLASVAGCTRALVPTFKSSHMSNTDIKKYFTSKFKNGSPQGYAVVEDKATAIVGIVGSASDDQSLNLVLPALDHHGASESPKQMKTEGGYASDSSKRQAYRDYEGARIRAHDEQSLTSSNPSDEGTSADHSSVSVSDSLGALSCIGPSVRHFAATAQMGHQNTVAKDPTEVPQPLVAKVGSTGTAERQMDEISLGNM